MSSRLNDDQLVINNGRDAFKGIDAPLKDQIRQKLFSKLEDMNWAQHVTDIWQKGNANRDEWLKRQQVYLQDLDEFVNSTAQGPFQGSSSLHVPLPLIAAKAYHARFLQAVVGQSPWGTVKARREDSIDSSDVVQDVLDYSLRKWGNRYQGCVREIDNFVWRWCTTGCGILKDRWLCLYERYIEVAEETEIEQQSIPVVDEKGNPLPPKVKKSQKEKVVTKTTFEGPELLCLENEDVLIIGGGGDPQLADVVIHSQWLTASELWTLVDRKIFDADAVEKIIKGGEDKQIARSETNIKQQRTMNAGVAMVDTESDLDRYQILETYAWVDVDGSGINSQVVSWSHPRSNALLHANYLRTLNKSGERPFFKADFHIRPGQDYGIGILEMLHPLSVEMDAMHNMRVDFGIMSNMPVGFYRASSSVNPETIMYQPGSLIPLDDPKDDIVFPQMGNRTAFGMQEEMGLYNIVEKLLSINDMSLGVMTGSQGATRTATGARALVQETNTNMDVFLRRISHTMSQMMGHRVHMLQQRIPKGLSFRVTGEAGNDYWRVIRDQDDIAGDFDFEVVANSSDSNPAIAQDKAQQVMQLVLNPLLIQTGSVDPTNIYEACKSYLKSLGVKDYGKYIKQPPNYQHRLTPEDEANRVLRGIPVPVTPEMDHQGFMDWFQMVHDSDELLGQFSKQQTIMLAAQAKKHEQMLQALEHMAAQAQNNKQQMSNAYNAQMQAPTGMNPMQGAPAGTPMPSNQMPGGGQ